MEQGKPVKTRFITVVTSFVVCLFASATWAQDSEWTPFTGADNLREKIAGTKFERQLATGRVSRAEYFADGTGVIHQYGASFQRTWEIKGEDQFCVTSDNANFCITIEQNTTNPNLFRATVVDSVEVVEFTAIAGTGFATTPQQKKGAKGGSATQPSAAEIAAELANPNTPMATVTFKVQFRQFEGSLPDADNQNGTTVLLQPSLPFPLANGDSILFRPALPFIIDQPIFDVDDEQFKDVSGIGDFAFDLAYARTADTGIITAGGIIASLPIGSSSLTSDRFTLGPEFMIGKLTSKYVLGIFPNHQWDVGGSGDKDINLSTIQLFATWLPGGGLSVGTAPIITYDFNSEQWTTPVNVNMGKTIVRNGRPWKLGLEINYYVDKADAFGPEWMVGFSIAPVVKNGMAEWFK